jgi:hypothetical protein
MEYDVLRRMIEVGPSEVAEPISVEAVDGWPRVVIRAHDVPYTIAATPLEPAIRVRLNAVVAALMSGLATRNSSWVTLETELARRIVPVLAGVEVLGSRHALPLTPLFGLRRMRTTQEVLAATSPLEWEAASERTFLEHHATEQDGFLHRLTGGGRSAEPLDERYARVAHALGDIVIRRAWSEGLTGWQPDAAGGVAWRLRFTGDVPWNSISVQGAGVLLQGQGLRVPAEPGGGAESPDSWLVAQAGDGPGWLVPPGDIAALGERLLVALLLHAHQDDRPSHD